MLRRRNLFAWSRSLTFFAVATTAFAFSGVFTVFALPKVVISQKGRQFHPTEIKINRGDEIQIVNDDADLLHHAYIESATLNFDSGDQGPGSKTNILFPDSGTFNVLCAIHPKMKLVVRVQ
jgi:plastocyanin